MSTENKTTKTNHTKTEHSEQTSDVSITLPRRKRSQAPALGSVAKIASHAQNNIKNNRAEATKRRFKLQSIARKLLPYKRVSTCLRSLIPGKDTVEVHHVPERDSAHFHNLRTCDSLWDCPVCAAKISERRRAELLKTVLAAVAEGYYPILVTWTLRHHKGDKLTDLLAALKTARQEVKEGRAWERIRDKYGWVGSVMATEVTHGLLRLLDNGWHPHGHDLVFLEPIAASTLNELENDLKAHWSHILERLGYDASWERGVSVKTTDQAVYEYITKYGHEPKDARWSVEREIAKAPSKLAHEDGVTPFQLLELYAEGNEEAGALFQEYSAAFHGKQQLRYSPGLRALLNLEKEKSDEQLAEEPEEGAVLLATLSVHTWFQLLYLPVDPRGDILAIASKGDAAALEAYIADLLRKDRSLWAIGQKLKTVLHLEKLGYRRVPK